MLKWLSLSSRLSEAKIGATLNVPDGILLVGTKQNCRHELFGIGGLHKKPYLPLPASLAKAFGCAPVHGRLSSIFSCILVDGHHATTSMQKTFGASVPGQGF